MKVNPTWKGAPLRLGDMEVTGIPDAKLLKALAVVASDLHPMLDAWHDMPLGKSRESCILCSCVVRDFLYRLGFRDADVTPTFTLIVARDRITDEEVHSLGIGNPQGPDPRITAKFDGHTVVRAAGWLIDPTLYQASPRPAWPDLPGMVVAPLIEDGADVVEGGGDRLFGLKLLAGIMGQSEIGHRISVAYLHQPTNTGWQDAPDYQRRHMRKRVTEQLVAAFGPWTDD
jgi:hypothetical protein